MRSFVLSVIFNFIMIITVNCNMVPLKVVNELPSNGYNNLNGLEPNSESKLLPRMRPANFSGPDHLRGLLGRCFKHRDTKYEYILCPFQNITQEDIQAYYDPYKGVLGVWLDWVIEDNQFVAWNMIEGSSCGPDRYRSTKVTLQCGKTSELKSMTEPERCSYVAIFETPEICGENAMVVYPRLPQYLQDQWNEALTDKLSGDLTEKGYYLELERVFIASGFKLSSGSRESLMDKAKASSDSSKSCQSRLEVANGRIIELEEELRMKEEIIMELQEGKVDL
ncbi:hypothetical protein SK128_025455 [Halocaridina rubra]|uniref:MRH domain-containing protein n=1 Tax=Halocaridina rubra TaxID=373956 RepID=A0AAN8WSU8_HALRR